MISINNVTKLYGNFKALDNVTATVKEASVFGLVGPNGSGKSTLMKVMSGAYKPDAGTVEVDGMDVYENEAVKQKIIYLSDDQYFMKNATINDMAGFYRSIYDSFDDDVFAKLRDIFKLDVDKRINTFSKGMQKQAAVMLGLSARPKYLFCDETFDGLDPVMRQFVKKLLANDTAEYRTTTILASHNLRELDDICDHIGLLHKGGILFEKELDELKLGIISFQCVLPEGMPAVKETFSHFDVVNFKISGSVIRVAIRGSFEETFMKLKLMGLVFIESIPLTLEEIFIEEMEGMGYDYSTVIL